ncbi:MAG: biopolymer transporter ExbD [Alphaproteobacteria bacterium]|uniref:ExbD/TolR family protein n=1 Tax=Pacificispira sp. TaxID=2888761 RepID=UPI0032F91347
MTAETGRLRHRKKGRRRAAISLTPLVDVVFILVIFFMLASSFTRTNSLGLVPPAQSRASGSAAVDDVLVLELLGQGRYKLDGQAVEAGALSAGIREDGRRRILLRPLDEAALQDMVTVLDITERLDLDAVSISVPPTETPQ